MIDLNRIWSSAQLPTLPAAAVRLLELTRNSDTELREIVAVIKTDPATCAKLLKSVNASYFGFSHPITTVDRAVPLLGAIGVTSLALSFCLADCTRGGGALGQHYSDCWRQSAAQAAAAEVLGEILNDSRTKEFALAGLLADLGTLAMLKTVPQDYVPVIERVQTESLDLVEIEQALLGTDHTQVGSKLMERWKLPAALCRAASLHHSSLAVLEAERDDENFPMIRAVAVAAAVGEYCCQPNKAVALKRLRSLFESLCGLPVRQIEDYLAKVNDRFASISEMFHVPATPLPDPADLLAEANEQLAQLAVSQHVATAQAIARQKLVEEQVRELQTKNQSLQQQVRHDSLTKLYNRSYFADMFERELSRCRRSGESIGLLFCDIDRFKSLNDTYGHPFGDMVLQKVAAVLSKGLRQCDVVARYGGEEFVVLVSHPSESGLRKVAERLRSDVAAIVVHRDGVPIPLTVSIGGALALPSRQNQGLNEELMQAADSAMYESKNSGRNRVTIRLLMREEERRLANAVLHRRFSRWLVRKNVLDGLTVGRVLYKTEMPRRPLGQLARQRGLLSEQDIDRILKEQATNLLRFGEISIGLGMLDAADLADLLARQQEDPRRLADALVADGLLDAVRADALVAAHAAERQDPADDSGDADDDGRSKNRVSVAC